MHCQLEGQTHTLWCAQIVVFDSSKDASRRLLYWRYTDNSEQCYNSMLFSRKVKWRLECKWCNGGLLTFFQNYNLDSFWQNGTV